MPSDTVSVLIASVAGDEGLFALLDSLPAASAHRNVEVVIADRVGEDFRRRLKHHHSSPLVLASGASSGIPALRRAALEAAHSDLVVVTEDHCIAPSGWLDRLLAPFAINDRVVAVAGPVQDELRGTVVDRATFLCDYAPFLPSTRPPEDIPGINTAYRVSPLRSALASVPDPDGGFWEGAVHRRLALAGELSFAPDAVLGHRKAFSLSSGLEQRFLQGRVHASLRWSGQPVSARLIAAAGAWALPALLSARTLTRAATRGGMSFDLVRVAPTVALLNAAGAIGEAAGALLGSGDALGRIV